MTELVRCVQYSVIAVIEKRNHSAITCHNPDFVNLAENSFCAAIRTVLWPSSLAEDYYNWHCQFECNWFQPQRDEIGQDKFWMKKRKISVVTWGIQIHCFYRVVAGYFTKTKDWKTGHVEYEEIVFIRLCYCYNLLLANWRIINTNLCRCCLQGTQTANIYVLFRELYPGLRK